LSDQDLKKRNDQLYKQLESISNIHQNKLSKGSAAPHKSQRKFKVLSRRFRFLKSLKFGIKFSNLGESQRQRKTVQRFSKNFG
jgi:hypothetical protein